MKFSIDSSIIKNKRISDTDKIIFSIIDSLRSDDMVKIRSEVLKEIDIKEQDFEKSILSLKNAGLVSDYKVFRKEDRFVGFAIKMNDDSTSIAKALVKAEEQFNEEKKKRIEKRRANQDNSLRMTNAEENSLKMIIAHLNEETGKRFRYNTKAVKSLILPQLRKGTYTPQDYMTIIDNMCSFWKNDPDMCVYLRPTTLFAERHLEDYLNKGKKKEGNSLRQKREERDIQRDNSSVKGW